MKKFAEGSVQGFEHMMSQRLKDGFQQVCVVCIRSNFTIECFLFGTIECVLLFPTGVCCLHLCVCVYSCVCIHVCVSM